ncbi:hypothetical protein [Xanthomonas citri]|uniref:hypothetical protein n=1 Tax=Xanthomonas citri TaxID=346 RepID=UPI0009C3A4DE|nr:hypothetical protein [Xanthomonas citri]AMV05376.1 hypothetical protein TP50_23600 [Xanthomonas citri pv. aurantifolii]TBW93305.1 hypothetical protein TP49_21970 [Xanthomonas citri pv. aurantifolii]
MPINANIFQLAKAIDLTAGTLFTIEEQWYVRGQLHNNHQQLVESAIPLTPGADYFDLGGQHCIALARPHTIECRVIGPIRGPGRPLPSSLTWTVTGDIVYTEPVSKKFITFAGEESNGVNAREAFFAGHWGIWVLDANGKEVSRDPLVVIGAEA